jgi:hypothetical protein
MLPNLLWDKYSYNDLFQDLKKGLPPLKPCFLAGTLVNTKNGLKAIETLIVGEEVYTYNFKQQQIELKSILKTYQNKTEKYINIHVKNDVIKATGNHRFWLPKQEQWVAASQLKVGAILSTQNNNFLEIEDLKVVTAIETTYNLEIKDNPNYYVGSYNILTHNTSKVSKYASKEIINVEFYEIMSSTKKTLYVGQTVQGIGKRYDQHRRDPKKAHWRIEMKGVFSIDINGESAPFKMTAYEAAVVELFEINKAGGKRQGNTGLYNKQNPIGKKKFNKYKKLGFNPCKFYV